MVATQRAFGGTTRFWGLWMLVLCLAVPMGLRGQQDVQERLRMNIKVAKKLFEKSDSLGKFDSWQDSLRAIQVWQQGVSLLEESAKIARSHSPEADSLLFEIYQKLGFRYHVKGEEIKSYEAYQACYPILSRRKDRSQHEGERYADLMNALATKASQRGEMATAVAYAREAVVAAEKYYGLKNEDVVGIVSTAASVLSATGLRAESKAMALKAWQIASRIPRISSSRLILAAVNLSDAYLADSRVDSSAYYLQRILPLMKDADDEQRLAIYSTLASNQFKLGKASEGMRYYATAVAVADTSHNLRRHSKGTFYVQFAEALRGQGLQDSALQYLQKALTVFVPDFKQAAPKQNPGRNYWNADPWVYEILQQKARCFEALGDVEQAVKCDTMAFNYLAYLRQGFLATDDRSSISAVGYHSYEPAIRLALKTFEETKQAEYYDIAFRLVEQSKTNAVLESLQEIAQGNALDVDPRLLEEWRAAKNGMMRHLASNDANSSDSLAIYKATMKRLHTLLEGRYPYLKQLLGGDLATPAAVAGQLRKGELFLEYFVGDSMIYTFVIAKDRPGEWYAVRHTRFFDKNLRDLMQSLGKRPGGTEKDWGRFAKYAHYMFKALLGPIIQAHPKWPVPTLLTIVPDGHIALIPFECLITDTVRAKHPFLEAHYLGLICPMRYGQSASTLLAQRQRPFDSFAKDFLGLAPNPEDLPPLSQGEKEVKNAADRFDDSQVLLGKNASQKAFFDQAKDYRVLHLSCHGQSDTLHPMRAWLALHARNDSVDTLYAHEIFEMKLNASLVVLSACHTGEGQVLKGEGVMSLARPFQAAGVPTTLMSLWSLDEKATVELMDDFYAHLEKGNSASRSMCLARQDYFQYCLGRDPDKAHPYYWAAMVAVGDEGPQLPQYEGSWPSWLIWGGLAALVIAWWQRRRRRRAAADRRR